MNKIGDVFCRAIYTCIVFAAVLSVNVTCYGRFYQEELNQQMDALRKYKDGE